VTLPFISPLRSTFVAAKRYRTEDRPFCCWVWRWPVQPLFGSGGSLPPFA